MKRRSFFLGWFWLAVAIPLLLLPQLTQATPIGGEPQNTCLTCACSAATLCVQVSSDTGTQLSLTEGNLSESLNLSRTLSTSGATMSFNVAYNSYNADGSRAQVDTVMGYGWTHSYNTFLFSQFGSMFRYDGRGRVARYRLVPNGFKADIGYFETLVKNNDGTFTLTQKDQTTFTFASIPNTSFLVEGPVWRLTSIVDRNGNTTTLTYVAGDLTMLVSRQ